VTSGDTPTDTPTDMSADRGSDADAAGRSDAHVASGGARG
jgi:hypothetical protein